ncbi:aspartate/glutamate racemase family protein [Bradyrhizobium sp. SSUT18]|uniref:aspartate/glutamate racemase family protein n=1 Tax=Bradyrhizobium sp. SSUT18 TaxID=3040602 RepID=UPI002449D15C|nr:aspartate/glutamate racemase family protein [Bradyrhizobium sp. SSUT18]MDH2401805.1 aspartate/glutamate racemase family protein [Bradyrhizobium sp. SSUT18]
MRIWHQSVTELDALPHYAESLKRRFAAVAGPGVEVVLHGVPIGTYGSSSPARALEYPRERNRVANVVLAQVERAELEGFDAVMIASFAEPALREARAALDIPVTSMMESCLLAGCSVAPLIGIVTISPAGARMLAESVDRHRLNARLVDIVSLAPAYDEFDLQRAFDEPKGLRAAFEAAARKAIDAGADVVIPGEGVLNEFVAHLDIRELDGVAVMDATALTLTYTEMLVGAYQRSMLRTGRRWGYPMVPANLRLALDTAQKTR